MRLRLTRRGHQRQTILRRSAHRIMAALLSEDGCCSISRWRTAAGEVTPPTSPPTFRSLAHQHTPQDTHANSARKVTSERRQGRSGCRGEQAHGRPAWCGGRLILTQFRDARYLWLFGDAWLAIEKSSANGPPVACSWSARCRVYPLVPSPAPALFERGPCLVSIPISIPVRVAQDEGGVLPWITGCTRSVAYRFPRPPIDTTERGQRTAHGSGHAET